MKKAIDKARLNMNKNYGGPFGACIVDKDGEIVACASNTVLKDNDPTAHAEINVIREACKKLNTRDLSDYILYTTCYPCPMCLGAIIWANITEVFYGCKKEDAANIGFRDDYIYNFIADNCLDKKVLKLSEINRDECLKLFEEYSSNKKEIY